MWLESTRRAVGLMTLAGTLVFLVSCGDLSASNTGSAELGTITAMINDQSQTWYLVTGTSQGREYASGGWMETGPGEHVVSLGGFETKTPPLDSFGWDGQMPTSFGDYTASGIVLTLPLWPDRVPYTVAFPIEEMGVMASVIHMPTATFDPAGMYELAQGVVEVHRVELNGGLATVEGTFSGTFIRMGGEESLTVTDGRFRGSRLPDLRAMAP